jgi:hypothetical protein
VEGRDRRCGEDSWRRSLRGAVTRIVIRRERRSIMKYGIAITHLILVLTVSARLAFAATEVPRVPPKGTEGPDVRVRVEPKGQEGPDVRRIRETDCHGVEGPDVRHHASASCFTL